MSSRRAAGIGSPQSRAGNADDGGNAGRTLTDNRPAVRSAGFVVLTLLGVGLCVFVAFPLLAPILWAMTLAIVAVPL